MLICMEFFPKNLILNFTRFSGGIGFRILVCIMLLEGIGFLSSVLYGIWREIGQWSEFRSIWMFVVEKYLLIFGKLM